MESPVEEKTESYINIPVAVNQFEKTADKLRTPRPDADLELDPTSESFSLRSFFENSVREDIHNGKKLKRVGVTFQNVTVVGKSAAASTIPDNLSPLRAIVRNLYPPNWFKSAESTVNILNNINGFCKDGEMLLVLGRPGAGCSTLLRTIANQRASFVDVLGDVSYGGIPAKEFENYSGEAIYIPEEDLHFPTLTVRECLDFALKTKTPGNLLPDETKRNFREKMLKLLLKMFGLTKAVDTTTGNEFIRGLSGGERKRLTIAEAMVSAGSIDCWDCSTRGLDSASALDYAKGLRIISDTMKKTTIATFYQASDSIYNLFDRVIVLEKGRCIYFGPTKDAKQYFLDMGFDCEPRKSTPDFLTGITNFQERKVRSGFEESVPQTSFALEKAWLDSDANKKARKELEDYKNQIESENTSQDFIAAIRESKRTGVAKKSKYTVNVWTQLMALFVRQYQILLGGKSQFLSRFISTIIMAIIYGTSYYHMKLTAVGAYARGGALFSALMFNAMIGQTELFQVFVGRTIISKQKSFAFYHPGLIPIAQLTLDIILITIQAILFTVIVYFLYGLDADAGKFFMMIVILFMTSIAINSLFKALGVLSPSLFYSQQALSFFFVFLMTYCGFFIPVPKMHVWFKWIHYINPFAYSFKALFANEMRHLSFDCSSLGTVPAGPAYMNVSFDHKACILAGYTPGQSIVTGDEHLQVAYGIDTDHIGIYLLALLAIWFFFFSIVVIGYEKISWVEGGTIRKVYKGGNAPKQMNEQEEREYQLATSEAIKNIGQTLSIKGGVFMWSDIKYTVNIGKGQKKRILDDVEGWIKPGQMTALMGASGAGKTTLLDVLAQRKTLGVVEGKMRLNGLPLRIDYERITGYVEQMDVHDPYLTVREILQFSARLRQEKSVPLSEKYAYVEQVLQMMEMSHLGDALIGSLETGVGIGIEERKRLTIGMELVARPSILFLDEPTSGLDSQSSYNIIKFIRSLADAGMPLVCTIHQPSSVLFEHFDRLLLLAKGGRTAYFGDIGPNSSVITEYFTRNGARDCLEFENPAEYILEVTSSPAPGSMAGGSWAEVWEKSPERKQVHEEIVTIEIEKQQNQDKSDSVTAQEYATGFLYQTIQVYKKLNVGWWRNPSYNTARIIQAAVVGICLGFSFWDLGNSSSDVQLRLLACFQILFLGMMLMSAAMPVFMQNRNYFRRDYASKFYSPAAFALGIIAVDIPYLTVAATTCVCAVYWSANLDSTMFDGFYIWIMFVLFNFFCVSFGQMVAAVSPHIMVGMAIVPILSTVLIQNAGVLNPPSSIPKFWKSWVYWINPYHYFLEGVVSTTLNHVEVVCTKSDFFTFSPPENMACGQYMGPFFAYGANGYLNDPSSTTLCEYCSYSSGTQWLKGNELDVNDRGRDLGLTVGFWAFNVIASCFLIYLFRKPRR